MGKVPFQYRKYFHVLSSSGSCTMAVPSPSSRVPLPSHALDTGVPQGTALHLQCVFSLIVLNNNSMLMIPGLCLFSPGLSPKLLSHVSSGVLDFFHLKTSRASYTHHVHWWSCLHQTSSPLLLQAYLIWWCWDPARYPRQEVEGAPWLLFLYPHCSITYSSSFILLSSVSCIPTGTDLLQALHISLLTITFQLVCKASSFIALKSISYMAAEGVYLEHKPDHCTLLFRSLESLTG